MSEDREDIQPAVIPLVTVPSMSMTPANWYWVVGNHSGVVYSSSAAAYVATTDANYTAWLNAGHVATNILSDGELADVLTKLGLEGAVVSNTAPTNWGACRPADITAAMAAAGVTLTSTGTPAMNAHYQLHGPFDTMMRTQIYINAHGQLPNNQPLVWPAYDVTVTFSTAAEFSAVYQGLQDYYNAWQHYAMNGGAVPSWGTHTIA
jgi:hypothetical protein